MNLDERIEHNAKIENKICLAYKAYKKLHLITVYQFKAIKKRLVEQYT